MLDPSSTSLGYTLNCSDGVTGCTVKLLYCFDWVLFLLCKVVFCFPGSICSLSAGKEKAALSTSLLLSTAFLLCSPKQEKNKNSLAEKKSLFLFFLLHCLLSTLSKSISFPQQNYTGCGCGCILNFILIYFSSFHRLLDILSMDQAKANVRSLGCLFVERTWYGFGCEDREFASLWIWINFFLLLCL